MALMLMLYFPWVAGRALWASDNCVLLADGRWLVGESGDGGAESLKNRLVACDEDAVTMRWLTCGSRQ